MWVAGITLFPGMFREVLGLGVLGRGIAEGLLDVHLLNPRDFTNDKHRTVDGRPYGGGAGMVMRYEPLVRALDQARKLAPAPPKIIYLSPQGARLDQAKVQQLAQAPSLVFVAGRYEGIDQRFIDSQVDEEISIGDFVLSGGELPLMVTLDAIARQIPGVLGNLESNINESHLDGLLEYPHYTRPENGPVSSLEGGSDIPLQAVPKVLLSGDHAKIERWRTKQALARTLAMRPDMLAGRELSDEERRLLAELFETAN